jgi:hypothetical protein
MSKIIVVLFSKISMFLYQYIIIGLVHFVLPA